MPKLLEMSVSVDTGVKALLEFLLKENKVSSIISLKKMENHKGIYYSLITRAEEINDALPLFPLMPANAGKLLSKITLRGSLTKPCAVVIKPCELRAYTELVKLDQANPDNFLFISETCPGVYPLETSVNENLEAIESRFRSERQKGEIIPGMRSACTSCIHFVPRNADIIVSMIGEKNPDEKCRIFLNSQKGEEFTQGFEGKGGESELETEEVNLCRDKRAKEREKLFEKIGVEAGGMEGITKFFGRCIRCHGCSSVCPICYCNLCFFNSQKNESLPSAFEEDLDRKGGVKIPAGTVFYHLGRLAHVSIACVACGMCEDVCPVDIPISAIFSKVGESLQRIFGYEPGRDVEEAFPLGTYGKDEFGGIGE